MIIDLRYHILSLVAVFLSLGIGLLIGGTMLESDPLVKSQKQITDRLEEQIAQLQQKNTAMQVQVNRLQLSSDMEKNFSKHILPFLVRDRLTGHKIAVIETNNYGFPDDMITTLQLAGAKIQSTTTVLRGFDKELNKLILKEKLGWKDTGKLQLKNRLAWEIARGIVVFDNKPVLDSLVEASILKISGEYGTPLSAVVLTGGGQELETASEQINLFLIDYFQDRKIPVFGVEETDILYSSMEGFQKKKISTIVNIDTVPGQVALVIAIAGWEGHYGVKPTAKKFLPPLIKHGES